MTGILRTVEQEKGIDLDLPASVGGSGIQALSAIESRMTTLAIETATANQRSESQRDAMLEELAGIHRELIEQTRRLAASQRPSVAVAG